MTSYRRQLVAGALVGKKELQTKRRTLYECSHARVNGNRIYCRKEYPLSPRKKDSGIEVRRLARGEELALATCQNCHDFDGMGPPIPPDEMGWIKKRVG